MNKGFESVNIHGCANAVIPVPAIGENGNWFIGNDDTGVSATGTGRSQSWKLMGSVSNTDTFTFNKEFDELYIVINSGTTSVGTGGYNFVQNVIKEILIDDFIQYNIGVYENGATARCAYGIAKNTFRMEVMDTQSGSRLNTTKATIYYR